LVTILFTQTETFTTGLLHREPYICCS